MPGAPPATSEAQESRCGLRPGHPIGREDRGGGVLHRERELRLASGRLEEQAAQEEVDQTEEHALSPVLKEGGCYEMGRSECRSRRTLHALEHWGSTGDDVQVEHGAWRRADDGVDARNYAAARFSILPITMGFHSFARWGLIPRFRRASPI